MRRQRSSILCQCLLIPYPSRQSLLGHVAQIESFGRYADDCEGFSLHSGEIDDIPTQYDDTHMRSLRDSERLIVYWPTNEKTPENVNSESRGA